MKFKLLMLLLAGTMAVKTSAQDLTPPKAKKVSKILEKHGHKRIDNYYWLNQREDK
jgi:oligopeptidase B